jgi:hypothetical protein
MTIIRNNSNILKLNTFTLSLDNTVSDEKYICQNVKFRKGEKKRKVKDI